MVQASAKPMNGRGEMLPYLRGLKQPRGQSPVKKSSAKSCRVSSARGSTPVEISCTCWTRSCDQQWERGPGIWVVKRQAIEEKTRHQGGQPPREREEDLRTPEELMDIIEAKRREMAEAMAELRRLTRKAAEGSESPLELNEAPPVAQRKEWGFSAGTRVLDRAYSQRPYFRIG
jgi:hypothetical protein